MPWSEHIKGFKQYLRLERSLAPDTVDRYSRGVINLTGFLRVKELNLTPEAVSFDHMKEYSQSFAKKGNSARTQRKEISHVRSFFKYLLLQDIITKDPAQLLDLPRIERKIPQVLDLDEIDRLLNSVDLTTAWGLRDRAIFETLYSCGIRVSELCFLKITDVDASEGYIRVIGKGNKERLVPIGPDALKYISLYKEHSRSKIQIKSGHQDYLFISRQGTKISRVQVFMQIRKQAALAGIRKSVGPHTLRHSYASHLVENGADLRAVQQLLGHDTIISTEIYVHFDKKHLHDTIKRYLPNPFKRRPILKQKPIMNQPINIL